MASRPVGGLDERSLEQLVDRLFQEALAPSTRRTYASAQGRYLEFCKVTARNPVPVDEHSLCVYVVWLHNKGLAHQSIKSYLSAVWYLQIACNLGDPNIAAMPRLEYVLKGVKVERARRLPLKVFWTEKNTEADSSMLWAAACVCFFDFFRSGEITVPSTNGYAGVHLSMADLAVDKAINPKMLRLCLKSSKTDPFLNIFMGKTGAAICPVTAMLASSLSDQKGHRQWPSVPATRRQPIDKASLRLLSSRGIHKQAWTRQNMQAIASASGQRQRQQSWE